MSSHILRYFSIYLLFSFLGWLWEFLAFGRSAPDNLIKKLFGLNLPSLQIYGVGAVILFFIRDHLTHYSMLTKIILAFTLVIIMECLVGQLSYLFFNRQTWRYPEHTVPFCSGYISVGTSLFWLMLIVIFFIKF